MRVGDNFISPADNVRNLGVIFDSRRTIATHIKLCRNLHFQLQNIGRIWRFLDNDTCHLVGVLLFCLAWLRQRSSAWSKHYRYPKTSHDSELGRQSHVVILITHVVLLNLIMLRHAFANFTGYQSELIRARERENVCYISAFYISALASGGMGKCNRSCALPRAVLQKIL